MLGGGQSSYSIECFCRIQIISLLSCKGFLQKCSKEFPRSPTQPRQQKDRHPPTLVRD